MAQDVLIDSGVRCSVHGTHRFNIPTEWVKMYKISGYKVIKLMCDCGKTKEIG